MTDESNTGAIAVVMGQDSAAKASTARKQRLPRRRKDAAELVGAASGATAAKSPIAKSRRSSEQERTEKLRLIEMRVTAGAAWLKDAIKSVGISEQTYYNWKRALKPVDQENKQPVPVGDEFADLVQLEGENHRLRKILAEKLRAENAELRKRLGFD
ncbi:transcriptional regulator [Agrobacterium rhizogenes]|uniref:transposase n=1 Tax=Rhizobium rhizogenes TaxID=359 RepID=UPI00115DF350|nr:transposase [Rhizobium rhizogenes]NTG38924.1 transcriptional regulator [Rhizobium rhizogenes]NTG58048.1 transcriptional regulator [Rhizobium rhizogenes]NTI06552.1 transcriptional regulator [Rhizobium rhizogenes]NTI13357.1 transcriptional regulator [Rhizobium rhizogenes]TRB15046.1 transcriptional regulator [Rhizobium rhizogenes]